MGYVLAAILFASQPVTVLHSETPAHKHFIYTYEHAYDHGCEDNPLFWAVQDIEARYKVRFVKHHRWTPYPRVVAGHADLGEIRACPCGCDILKLRDILVEHYSKTYFVLHYEYVRSHTGWKEYRSLILKKIKSGEVANGFDGVWDWDEEGYHYIQP